jgi:hypothetical protein
MPNVTVYLTDELYQLIRGSPSHSVQEALKEWAERHSSKKRNLKRC